MASHAKNAQQFARQLFKLSVVDGAVSADRVAGVARIRREAQHPANPVMVLKAYHRLVATELAKSLAVVEHAGAIQEATLAAIAAAMTRKYGRTRHGDRPSRIRGSSPACACRWATTSTNHRSAGQLATLASSV